MPGGERGGRGAVERLAAQPLAEVACGAGAARSRRARSARPTRRRAAARPGRRPRRRASARRSRHRARRRGPAGRRWGGTTPLRARAPPRGGCRGRATSGPARSAPASRRRREGQSRGSAARPPRRAGSSRCRRSMPSQPGSGTTSESQKAANAVSHAAQAGVPGSGRTEVAPMHHEPCSVAVGHLRHRVRVGGAVVDDHHRDDRRKGAQQQVERGGPVLHRNHDGDVVDVGVRSRLIRPPRVGEATVEQLPGDPAHQRPVTDPAGQRRDDPGGLRREEQHRARRTADEGASVVADLGAVGEPCAEVVREPALHRPRQRPGHGVERGRHRSQPVTACRSPAPRRPSGPTPWPAISRTTRVTICSSRRRPSSALAPVGSPSTPLAETRAHAVRAQRPASAPGPAWSCRAPAGRRAPSRARGAGAARSRSRPRARRRRATEQAVQATGRPSSRSRVDGRAHRERRCRRGR